MSGESIEWGAPGVLNGVDDGGLEGMSHYGDEVPPIKCAASQRTLTRKSLQ
jgi:hypothetical protein